MTERLLSTLLLTTLFACQPSTSEDAQEWQPTRAVQIHERATALFDTYAERKDWNKLLSFYREDLVFQDLLLQLNLDSLWQFERFYNWPDTNFRKLTLDQRHLEIEHLAVNDDVASPTGISILSTGMAKSLIGGGA